MADFLTADPNLTVYLNGDFIPLDKAQVSVLDRGFLFGDGVYEVIPVYAGHPFRLHRHLQRLQRSLEKIRLPLSLDDDHWQAIIEQLLPNKEQDFSVYIQITRGVTELRDHALPQSPQPTLFAMCSPIPARQSGNGISATTVEDTRWLHCDIKAITLLANILLRQQAVEDGYAEAILVRDGLVTEGAASNVFIMLDGELMTPPKGCHLLPGITRDVILELAEANQITASERDIPFESLLKAEEIWLTSSTKEIMPVVELNGKPVGNGNGRPGPAWQRMHELYQAFKQSLRAS